MYAIDFEYDGHYLSDYNFIVCNFEYSNSSDIIAAGSKITFNKVARNFGKIYTLTSAKYEECIQATFDICKNPDVFDRSDMIITKDEYKDLARWLNRRMFLPLQFLDDEYEGDVCRFNASFNIEQIKIGDRLCGLRLTMETDSPFGYGQEQICNLQFTSANSTHTIYDVSDDIGYLYPNITITCGATGDLILYNDTINSYMEIKNCSEGEEIYICGNARVISSSFLTHDIADDFNYVFLRIENSLNNRANIIRANSPCTVVIRYYPVVKAML